jgi:hypothetical protein
MPWEVAGITVIAATGPSIAGAQDDVTRIRIKNSTQNRLCEMRRYFIFYLLRVWIGSFFCFLFRAKSGTTIG